MVHTTPVEMHAYSLQKNAHAFVHARLCNGEEASLPWKVLRTYLESCVSIVQAIVCRPPSCRLDEIRRPMLFAQEICPNPCQRLAYDVVAAAVSHKHYLIIRVSAGLIHFVSIFAMVSAGFFMTHTPIMTSQVMIQLRQPKFISIYFCSHRVLYFFVSSVAKTKLSNH